MKHYLKLISMITASLLLGACAMFSGVNQATIKMQSAQYLNPDINGRPSPIVVTFYQLKSPFSFKQANYNSLANNSSSALGTDLLDKQTTEIPPGKYKEFSFPIARNAKYIGIVAGYRNINQATWHKVVKIDPKDNNTIHLDLESEAINASATTGGLF